jgi:hypothetical protein
MNADVGKSPLTLRVFAILIIALIALNIHQYLENTALTQRIKDNEVEISELNELVSLLQSELTAAKAELIDTRDQLVEFTRVIEGLRVDLDLKSKELSEAEAEIEKLEGQLDEKTWMLMELNTSLQEVEGEIARLTSIETKGTYTLGVRLQGGIAIPTEIEASAGKGLFLDTEGVLLDETVQHSYKIAYYVATGLSGKGLDGRKLVLRFKNPTEDTITISGDSAGAVMALAMIAIALDREFNSSVLITGAILSDGRIGRVSNIWNKAQAAKSVNATVLLVPMGQKINVEGIELVEVSNITKAMEYMFT